MQRKSLIALSAGALLLCAGTMDSAQAQYRWRMPGGPGGWNHGWHNAGWGGGWRGGWGGGWRGGWGGGWNGGWGAFGAGALLGAATSLVTAPLWSGGYGYGYGGGYPGYAADPGYAAYSYPDYGYAAPVAYETVPVVYRQRIVVRRPVVYRTHYVAPRRFYAVGPVYGRAYGGWGPRRHFVAGPAVGRWGHGGAWRYRHRVY
jgi:hypothetical protein